MNPLWRSKAGGHSQTMDRTNGLGMDHSRVQRPASTRYRHAGTNSMAQQRPPPTFIKPANGNSSSSEVTLRLSNLSLETTTYDILQSFQHHGNLAFIQIFSKKDGTKDSRGMLRFSPAPTTAFWEKLDNHTYPIKLGDKGTSYNARVYYDEYRGSKRGPLRVQSPLQRTVFYSAKMKLVPTSLDFGIMTNEETFMSMTSIKPIPGFDFSFEVDLLKKRIDVTFVVDFKDPRHEKNSGFVSKSRIGLYDRQNKYLFRIPFSHIKQIYRHDTSSSTRSLLVPLENPPFFYRKREDAKASHTDQSLLWTEFDTWYRQTDVVFDPYRLQTAVVTLHKEKPVIDIGRWTTYEFKLDSTQNDMKIYDELQKALSDFNIDIIKVDKLSFLNARTAEVWPLIDHPKPKKAAAELQYLGGDEGSYFLPFEVRYQLEVCISRDILNEYNITKAFVLRLATMAGADPDQARFLLEYIAEQDKPVYDPMTIFEDEEALAFSSKAEIPHYCAYARKAIITPTTIYFSTPTVETTNRVLRHYARENLDGRFLRVQFTDEMAEGRINHCADKQRDDELFTRVYRTLYNGIRIGDRLYQFLAFGNSQFRENGAYFFCATDHLSCDDIRNWMGNFSHINVVAKYAARLGQCFSTTRAIHGLAAPDIITIPDIERKFDGVEYCFTDGVGKISPFLAQLISAELGLRLPAAPSAFQFRLGGCKGILAVSLDAKDQEVHIRKSQQKFTATYNGLEIVRWSRFSAATLNRQTITILSSLGVPDRVFLKMLAEQLQSYHNAMSDHNLAQTLLTKFIDENQMTVNIATMINNGFMTEREPFVLSLLQLWRSWSIKLLKEKAKIVVENGAFLLGCVDETNTLKGYVNPTVAPGELFNIEELPQIFVQIPQKDDATKYNVLEGICIVGRNPSLHPGDLRVVKAVNVPALYHLRDVIVFPQQGVRDVPSMCSGGDLDGDDFFVIWDRELQPPEWNAEPMNYQAPTPKTQAEPVRVTDLMKFFVRFMKNDALPTIAHAHLGNSDYLDDGVKHEKCLKLAALHSKAVDYVKTGQPAEMPKHLKCDKWPHFMEKRFQPKEKQYHSDKILGQLYDKVDSVDFKPKYEEPFDKRILRAYKLDDNLLKKVRKLKSQYDNAMRRIMAQQEIGTEFEVWSTFVLSKPRVGTDYKQQEDMSRISDALKDRWRLACIQEAGGHDFDILGPFVAGMYRVTKEELDIALTECHSIKIVGGQEVPMRKMEARFMPLISYPWLFEKELGRIATGIDSSDELDPILPPLDMVGAAGQRKRATTGHLLDIDDFIQLNGGKTIHRGEVLDLFSLDNDDGDLDNDSDFEEARSKRGNLGGHSTTLNDCGEIVVASDFQNPTTVPEHLLSGTGVEDVVPWTDLDGLIDPRESVQLALSMAFPENQFTPTPTVSNITSLSGSFADLAELDENLPTPDIEPVEEEELAHVNIDESALDRLTKMVIDKSDSEESGEIVEEVVEEIEEEEDEEEVETSVKESALERLARFMDS